MILMCSLLITCVALPILVGAWSMVVLLGERNEYYHYSLVYLRSGRECLNQVPFEGTLASLPEVSSNHCRFVNRRN